MELTVSELKDRWDNIQKNIIQSAQKFGRNPDEIIALAVSKTHSADMIINAISAGITTFAENYVQEFLYKYESVREGSPIQPVWHYIGHLQTNKVKYIAPFVTMIHSVDSLHLAEEIEKQAIKNNRIIDILLQVNTSGEASKFGCDPEELIPMALEIYKLPNLKINGLMTIGTFSDDEVLIRREFRLLRSLKEKLAIVHPELDLKHLSMGMTHDYPLAIEEGATVVRIGTAIFGSRNYS